jgi:N-acetylglutamate synthase-like GNAT family acetyltransferase
MTDSDGVTVRMLKDAADAAAFRALNEEWIARYFVLEERDHRQLDNPVAAYIDTGGAILIAELDGRPIGCVAVAPDGTGAWELSKMAVASELRVGHARDLGARSMFLGTSWKLPSAVHLYETFGFRHVPRETLRLASTRIDVFMELLLS